MVSSSSWSGRLEILIMINELRRRQEQRKLLEKRIGTLLTCMTVLTLIAIAFLLSGCASADTHGPIEDKNYNLKVTNNGPGLQVVYMPSQIDATRKTITDQETAGEATATTKGNASLTGEGPAQVATEGAGLFSVIEQWWKQYNETTEKVIKPDPEPVITPTGSEPEKSPDITTTRIRWKPVAENDGKLVVLLPSSYGNPGIQIFDVSERGRYVGGTNPDSGGPRATYRFSKPGGSYPDGLKLQVGTKVYIVPDSGKNYNK